MGMDMDTELPLNPDPTSDPPDLKPRTPNSYPWLLLQVDTKMSLALGQKFLESSTFTERIFTTGAGVCI